MKYIAVYDKDETDYVTRRRGFLQNAKDVCITQSINGDYSLEFKLPQGDSKWALIENELKVGYDGKIFRIKSISEQNITAISLLQDTCRTHIQYIGDMIGKSAYEIFEAIFSATPYVTVLSTAELEELGLEPVTDTIDFFEMSRKTPIGCLNILMETLKKYRVHSEIYIDNERIGLVRRLGKDRGVVIDQRYNAKIKPLIDTYNLVTKIYPYGKDGLPLSEAAYQAKKDGTVEVIPLSDEDKRQGKRGYVLSPNYELLGEYEGFCNFDEITEPEDLLSAAQLQFDSKNIERIDIPKYCIEIKLIDVKGDVKLGDTVTVNDTDNGIKSKQRVITTKFYPYEPNKNAILVGVPPMTEQEAYTGMFEATQYLRHKRNERKELKTDTLEFMKKNEDVTVENNKKFQKIAQYKTGAMFVSPNGEYAVAIIDGKIKIGVADSSKEDGWNWIGVFGHGEGDDYATTYLYTNLITIAAQNGTLKIEGNMIQMFDSAGTLRFNAGYAEGLNKYVFELYDPNGKRNMYIDDNGNLTMRGVFKTGEDGEARTVIDGNGIQSYDEQNRKSGLWCNDHADLGELILYSNGDEFFRVYNSKEGPSLFANGHPVLIMSSSGATGRGNWGFENGADGVFTTPNNKRVTVRGGLITDISDITVGE